MHILDLMTYIIIIGIIVKIVTVSFEDDDTKAKAGITSTSFYTVFHIIYFCVEDNNVIDIIESITL